MVPQGGEPRMPSIRVLIVDDFVEWRLFVSRAIGEIVNLQIVGEACDGVEAVQKATDLKPDLAVLDIGLPKLNGIEVAREIRKLCPECRIVFLTENPSKDVIEECFRAGACGYIVKSSGANELVPAIKAALNGKVC